MTLVQLGKESGGSSPASHLMSADARVTVTAYKVECEGDGGGHVNLQYAGKLPGPLGLIILWRPTGSTTTESSKWVCGSVHSDVSAGGMCCCDACMIARTAGWCLLIRDGRGRARPRSNSSRGPESPCISVPGRVSLSGKLPAHPGTTGLLFPIFGQRHSLPWACWVRYVSRYHSRPRTSSGASRGYLKRVVDICGETKICKHPRMRNSHANKAGSASHRFPFPPPRRWSSLPNDHSLFEPFTCFIIIRG